MAHFFSWCCNPVRRNQTKTGETPKAERLNGSRRHPPVRQVPTTMQNRDIAHTKRRDYPFAHGILVPAVFFQKALNRLSLYHPVNIIKTSFAQFGLGRHHIKKPTPSFPDPVSQLSLCKVTHWNIVINYFKQIKLINMQNAEIPIPAANHMVFQNFWPHPAGCGNALSQNQEH